MRSVMEKAFGTLVRQLRLHKGYSLRELARRIDVSPNFLSKMELGHFPPPGEKKIVLIAEILEQNADELLALAGKVSSDLVEIILQRPKETAALLRRLRHAPARKIAAAKDRLAQANDAPAPTERWTLHIERPFIACIKAEAKAEHVTVTEVINRIIRHYYKR
jgi:transcriptional regulator with XRE-family HTH domain